MPLWKNTDAAANSANFAAGQLKKTANSANRDNLFGNTTADAFVADQKVGLFGVSAGEMQASRAGANTKMAHAGWNLRIEGTGGRAGRVQYETLVAMSSISGDAEDAVLPDYKIRITSNPSNASANSSDDEIATFTVGATSTPTGATLTYVWQKWGGSAFANLAAAGAYSNVDTAELSVLSNTASNGEIYRVLITATGAENETSSNGVLTVTS